MNLVRCQTATMGCETLPSMTTESAGILILGNGEWHEQPSLGGFKLWHIMFMFMAALLAIVICLCCCIRFRIPRTKQEIEADYVRKKITRKFQKQLKLIQNTEMDDMDLKKAMERIRADFRSESEIAAQSTEALSESQEETNYRRASDIGSADVEDSQEPRGLGARLVQIVARLGRGRHKCPEASLPRSHV